MRRGCQWPGADTESLMQAVENKDIEIGIDFPDGFAAGAAAG